MTLRARLVLAALYVLSVVAIGLEVPLAVSVSGRETRKFESGILTNAALLAARINDDLPAAGTDPSRPPAPPPAIDEIVSQTTAGVQVPSLRFVVTDRLGRVVSDSANEASVGEVYMTPDRPEFAQVMSTPGGTVVSFHRRSDTLGQDLLVTAVPVVHNREVIGVVRATVPLDTVQADIRRLWLGFAAIGVLAVLVGLAAAWFLATSLVRPVRRLEETAVRLGEGELSARADPQGPKEVATLATSFNRMAGALGANMAAQRDFLANASHQLRTPLTGLRLRLEAIRGHGGPAAEEAAKAERDVDRLASLVEDLLILARASSAETRAGRVDLGEATRQAGERWRGPARESGKDIDVVADGRVTVWADDQDLAHLLDSLIENAVRYAPEGAQIQLQTGLVDGRAVVSVHDDGPRITPKDAPQVFERFFRGTQGRMSGPGTGLGLAIARELARRWGGEIALGEGPGTTFEVSFPRPPADS
jgi:signal transduction histidine kinase